VGSGPPPHYPVATVKSFHVTTFGCQMNEHDSERMKGMLESLGYREVAERRDADLILFNTCSIREKADDRFVAHLGEAKALKRRDPERVIGVGGCWAQSVKDEVFRQFPFVDVAFGPGQVHKLAEFLTSDSLTAQGYFEFEGFTGHLPMRRARRHQAWMQISVGCNCRCSYCIVPSTRGREVSRPQAEVVAEAERLAADGVREITLLGQNVNAYGRDLRPERATFAGLLAAVDAVAGISRIRYTSPHPKDMREDVVRAHAELPSVCEHIHLPLQAGSSRVLKAMRRTYSRERYLDRVALIREHVPDVALTTDVIVGFPGETEADFRETLEVVEEVGYDGAFTFIFSPRRGTEAANLPDDVTHEEKVERMQRLVEVVQRRARERAQRFVGRTMEVLVEGASRTDPDRLRGRTRHNKVVNFGGLAQPGDFVQVEILEATSQTLRGQQARLLLPAL
jgi:tRNA-2-methylthio-N6-dimethylallyladenosine synthase